MHTTLNLPSESLALPAIEFWSCVSMELCTYAYDILRTRQFVGSQLPSIV